MEEEDQEEQEQEEDKEDEEDKDKDEPDQIPEEFVFEAEVSTLPLSLSVCCGVCVGVWGGGGVKTV